MSEESSTPEVVPALEAALDEKFAEVYPETVLEPAFSDLADLNPDTPEVTDAPTEPAESPDPAVPEEAPADEGNKIDPSLVALAVQEGADQAAVDELIASDPVAANELLMKLADEVNTQTLRSLQSTPEVATPETVPGIPTSEGELSPLEALLTDEEALAAAKEEFGESLVEKFLLPQAKQAKANRETHAYLSQLRQETEAAQQQAAIAELNASFVAFGTGYSEFYGTDFSSATDAQVANRQKVTQIADRLRSADFAAGVEAKAARHYITQAHHVVAADERKAATRRELLSQIQTRSRSAIARPTKGQSQRISGGSEEAAHQALSRRMAELGVEDYFRD